MVLWMLIFLVWLFSLTFVGTNCYLFLIIFYFLWLFRWVRTLLKIPHTELMIFPKGEGVLLTVLFLPCGPVPCRDVDDSVGVDVEGHFDLGDSSRGRGNANLRKASITITNSFKSDFTNIKAFSLKGPRQTQKDNFIYTTIIILSQVLWNQLNFRTVTWNLQVCFNVLLFI